MSDDADPRYALANERTFLAWIRTALGLLVAAAALVAVDLPWPSGAVSALAAVLAVTGGLSAVLAWDRWRRVQVAIDEGQPAPPARAHAILTVAVAAVAAAVVVLIFL